MRTTYLTSQPLILQHTPLAQRKDMPMSPSVSERLDPLPPAPAAPAAPEKSAPAPPAVVQACGWGFYSHTTESDPSR